MQKDQVVMYCWLQMNWRVHATSHCLNEGRLNISQALGQETTCMLATLKKNY